MQFRSVRLTAAYEGRTAASVLKECFSVSETYLRRLKLRPNSVLLNGRSVYVVEHVHAGDELSFDPSDPEKLPIRPIPFPLAIVYEDDWLCIVNKPKHLAVHPARDPDEPTLENALAAHFTGRDNPHPVSRLDKDTTGLIAIAKSGYVHALMKRLQADGRYQKTYLAILDGVPEEPHFFIDAPIGPVPGSTYARTVRQDGAPARSECTLKNSQNGLSLVRLVPHTGRTHQLRVHLAYIGLPLLGDWLYGTRSDLVDRPLLHAESLAFEHPVTGEALRFSAPIPKDFQSFFSLPM